MKFLDKLKLFYQKYNKHILDAKQNMTEKEFNTFYHFKLGRLVNDDIIKIFDYEGFPKIVSKKDYSKLNSVERFHGFKKFEFGYQFLTKQDFRKRDKTGFSNGFYSTQSFDYTKLYTNVNNEFDENRVLKFKLVDDENGVDIKTYDAIIEGDFSLLNESAKIKMPEIVDFLSSIQNDENCDEFIMWLYIPTSLLVILGYDYFMSEMPFRIDEYNEETIILNRGSISVCEDEFEKFKVQCL